MTAMTRDRGAHCRTTCKLCRSAPVSIVALTMGLTASSAKYAFAIGLGRIVLELGVLAEECQLHLAGRTITLFRNDDVRNAFARRVRIVNLFPIDQQNDVSI